MMNTERPSPLILGLALFAMFFGSGNLIFPLWLGTLSEQHWLVALLGFTVTAVGLPLLGVWAMVLYQGCYKDFFNLIGKKPGFLLALALLIVWIPLGSAPRCIALSFASLSTYLSIGPLWIYALFYSGLVASLVIRRNQIINVIGKYLTPTLLLSLFAISLASWQAPQSHENKEAFPYFWLGILEGYNTMDLIASFFFSASIIYWMSPVNQTPSQAILKLVGKGGVVAAAILTLVYGALLYAAAAHSVELASVPKEQALAFLAKHVLGESWGSMAAIAIFLACLTTSIALIVVFSEFMCVHKLCGTKTSFPLAVGITSFISYIMALTGLKGITFVTEPVLQIGYPFLAALIVWGIFKKVQNRILQPAEDLIL